MHALSLRGNHPARFASNQDLQACPTGGKPFLHYSSSSASVGSILARCVTSEPPPSYGRWRPAFEEAVTTPPPRGLMKRLPICPSYRPRPDTDQAQRESARPVLTEASCSAAAGSCLHAGSRPVRTPHGGAKKNFKFPFVPTVFLDPPQSGRAGPPGRVAQTSGSRPGRGVEHQGAPPAKTRRRTKSIDCGQATVSVQFTIHPIQGPGNQDKPLSNPFHFPFLGRYLGTPQLGEQAPCIAGLVRCPLILSAARGALPSLGRFPGSTRGRGRSSFRRPRQPSWFP